MKNLIIILAVLIFPICANSQNSINHFYKKHKRSENVTKFTVPGWVVKIASSIAASTTDDEQEKEAIKIAKKIKKLKLLVMEDHNTVKKQDYSKLISNLKADSFEDLLVVNSEGTKVNMLIREKKGKIKNFLLLVNDDTEFVMISIKSKLKIKDLQRLIDSLQNEFELDNLPKPTPKPKEPQA